jgi:hypothetical protein
MHHKALGPHWRERAQVLDLALWAHPIDGDVGQPAGGVDKGVVNGSCIADPHDVWRQRSNGARQGGLAYAQLFNELPRGNGAACEQGADGFGVVGHGVNGAMNGYVNGRMSGL